MYVSLWFLLACVVTVAVVYILNNLAVPVSWNKSYSIYAGVNDANVQWWFGHNAVASVFTFPILAMFYYFLPKSTGVPIYSHRLSIIAFWSLVFGYLWTGAHHLMLTPLPEWIQTVALAFSIFLIAPSWGSVVNGYYTMGGNWEKMKSNYLAKFFLLGITFYGLQTIQGPTQALRSLTGFLHYTEYIPGHVHMGTMGWVTMVITASMYYVVTRVSGRELHSVKLANVHFWLILFGQLLFTATLWVAGIVQGAMWKATNPDGSLTYSFLDSVAAMYPFWSARLAGGLLYFAGVLVFAYNMYMTTRPKAQAAWGGGR
jgi:cytochrome c oxidase cbb3-type subunit 1